MDIREYSSQFTIYIFTTDVNQGASVKVHLSQAGYDVYFINDPEALELRLKQNAPHILLFSTAALAGALSDFVAYVQAINDEIKFVALASAEQFDNLSQYNSSGFLDVILENALAIEARSVWAVDRACEKIYLNYQNEQLYDDLQKEKNKLSDLENQNKVLSLGLKSEEAAFSSSQSIAYQISSYRSCVSKEEMIQSFLNRIRGTVCIFFKYLPSVRSFVATHANGIEASQIQGVGCQLSKTEVQNLESELAMGTVPSRFHDMLVEAFSLNPPRATPLFGNQEVDGAFVYSGALDAKSISQLNEELALFCLCYTQFVLEKRVDALEVHDKVTELFNLNYFNKSLSEEVVRAKRLKTALALIKISLDNLSEIHRVYGDSVRDELYKDLAMILNKSSRGHDINCRIGYNEFAIILPQCSKKGASIRAERLRRIIETASFLEYGIKISISLGVSEYPSLSGSAKELDESASKALSYISEKGGNKICLYKVAESFRPEFDVEEIDNK